MSLLTVVHGRGTTAAKPTAAAANEGYIYFDTTLGKLQRSSGSAWEDISETAAGATITTKDEGTSLSTTVTTLDFVGAGVVATGAGATTTVTIAGGGLTFSACRAYNSTTQAINGGPTVLTLDSEDYDTDTYHSTVTNTGRLTVPATGYYQILAATSVSGTNTYIYLRKNGATYLRGSQFGSGSVIAMLRTFALESLTAADYVEVLVYTGSALNVGSTTVELMTTVSIQRVA